MSTITLTSNQLQAVNLIKEFVISDDDVFILTGAAGTGKTTVVRNIIDSISDLVDDVFLLAPTNRAAKVLSKKTGIPAGTVHTAIYRINEVKDNDGHVIYHQFVPKIAYLELEESNDGDSSDSLEKYLVIVDESSMLSALPQKEGKFQSNNSLLQDLINYVKYENKSNKLIFVGDSYQLPPIGYDGVAPALDQAFLIAEFNLEVKTFELTKILRQAEGSAILQIAQRIKEGIDKGLDRISINPFRFQSYSVFIEKLATKFDPDRPGRTIALGWRRVDVLQMNIDIREKLFGNMPNDLEVGDVVYVNVQWGNKFRTISKGEIGKIIDVKGKTIQKGELHFTEVSIEFINLKGEPFIIDTIILTDYLYHNEDFLPKQIFQKLIIQRSIENGVFKKSKNKLDDKYVNAMQVKFAYALTVHKAQGGEWENVFIHSLTNWKDLRWNYTAVTRAVNNIYSYWR